MVVFYFLRPIIMDKDYFWRLTLILIAKRHLKHNTLTHNINIHDKALYMLVHCVLPPTFNRLLDFSVLPLDLIHHFVFLLLLFPLSVFDLLLLLSVSLLRLVLGGVLCGTGEKERFQVNDGRVHKIYSRSLHLDLCGWPVHWTPARCFTSASTLTFPLSWYSSS